MKTCGELMTREPVICVPTDSAARVAKVMKSENIGAVPVCEDRKGKRLIGIVTDRDLALQIVAEGRDANTTKVEDLMTPYPRTCYAADDIEKAFEAMETYQVRRVPIIADQGQLIGIIAQADLLTRDDEPEKTAAVIACISQPTQEAPRGETARH